MTNFKEQIPNSVALQTCYAGTEVYAGVPVTPTFKLYGEIEINARRPVTARSERNGTFFDRHTPIQGLMEVDGTYTQALTFEDLAILPRYCVNDAAAPLTDGETTPGYTNSYAPHPNRIRLDLATVEYGFPGLVEKASGLYFPEMTIRADTDDSEAEWEWSSRIRAISSELKADTLSDTATGGSTSTIVKTAAGWSTNAYAGMFVTMTGGATTANIGHSREIVSNTATTLTVYGLFPSAVANTDTFTIGAAFTSGISERSREAIPAPGTKFFIDDSSAAIGTTQITGELISFDVTYNGAEAFKRFMENQNTYAARLDQGAKVVSGQVRLEHSNRREVEKFKSMSDRALRFLQTGSVIDSGDPTYKHAQIDIYRAIWVDSTPSARANNLTRTYSFWGFYDATETNIFEIEAKHTMSALP